MSAPNHQVHGVCVHLLEQLAGRGPMGRVRGAGMRTGMPGGQRDPAVACGTYECACAGGPGGGCVCLHQGAAVCASPRAGRDWAVCAGVVS